MRRQLLAFGFTALALMASPLQALEPSPAGEPAVYIVVSDSPEVFRQQDDTGVAVNTSKEVNRGEKTYISFLATGLTPADGNVDYAVSWKLYGPTGKLIAEKADYAEGAGEAGDGPGFYVPKPSLVVSFEPEDPTGLYTIKAELEDDVTGKRATRRYQFRVSG